MEFLYTVDPSAEEPIMLIDSHIGADETGEGIMGDKFTRELMFLDTLNKKSIQVWINSEGGAVMDGEKIYHAILKSKTPVDTHNTGTAASIAGPIFLAGRNRYMMDYAKLMMHPVSGGDEKSSKAFTDSITKMLSSRSFLSEENVNSLMKKTSWIEAEESKAMGLCTHIESSAEMNVKNIIEKRFQITNRLQQIKNTIPMIKVINKLKLVSGANEDQILEAINKMELDAIENKSRFDKMVDELASAKKSKEEADNAYNALKAKYDEKEKEDNLKKEEECKNKAKALIAEGVKAGKIVNKAETIEKWEKQAIADLAGTTALLEEIPVTKTGYKKPENKAPEKTGEQDNERPDINLDNPNAFLVQNRIRNMQKVK